ncbi:hypothetical protein [Fulvimonas soli]|uniref:hypothetical protein n=1 Tax=Fulvimonas soli TaxID=155197 RepID=UPI00111F42C2|nr:hypothetical protein [Fulvimonas soli]
MRRVLVAAPLLCCAVAPLPRAARAVDTHRAVQAKPGEIVLMRDVASRPAYRQGTPGMALIVDPSPRAEIGAALGTEELSDADASGLSAGGATGHQTTVERVTGGALGAVLGTGNGNGGNVAGNGVSNVVSGPLGAVGGATGGIGAQVTGAIGQLPLPMPAAAGH